ncbi:MAG: histidine kinase, partial [Bacteroidales bacterium]|nr:histidine kinase [Bacteroidales bacterium]
PHFIFNALISIQNFIYSNDAKNADKFLTKFSRLLRLILQNSRTTYISIDDEVNTITNYLELQKLRFDDKFNYSFIVDSKIDKESVLIPPMLAQPFIENSIEHGFVEKSKKYNLNIGIWLVDEKIVYVIEDDGIGINKSTENKKSSGETHESLGMQITKERMLNLKKTQKQTIEYKIEDLNTTNSNKQGTRVVLTIQVKNLKNA